MPAQPVYAPEDAAADLDAYRRLRRDTIVRTVALAAVVAAVLTYFASPKAALGWLTGALCGMLNMLLTMYGTERVVERGNVKAFVISSFLRTTLFAIVPLGFALGGLWWTAALYFAGFFIPLALYAAFVRRAFERK